MNTVLTSAFLAVTLTLFAVLNVYQTSTVLSQPGEAMLLPKLPVLRIPTLVVLVVLPMATVPLPPDQPVVRTVNVLNVPLMLTVEVTDQLVILALEPALNVSLTKTVQDLERQPVPHLLKSVLAV